VIYTWDRRVGQLSATPSLTQIQGIRVNIDTSTIVLIAHWTIIFLFALRVIMRRRPVGVSLAWLAVIFSVPLFGVLCYLLFGEKRLGKQRSARIAEILAQAKPWLVSLREHESATNLPKHLCGWPLETHADHVTGIPALKDNSLVLLDHYQAIFDAMIADIDAATRSCRMQFYIWNEGGRGDDIIDALVHAAKRGVVCRVTADGMGSKAFLRGSQVKRLHDAGIEVVTTLTTGLIRSFFVRADLRNHRKIVVIDDRIAYTGSQNLVDPRFFKQDSGVGEWVDAMVRFEGPAVAPLSAIFEADRCVETGEAFTPPVIETQAHDPSGRDESVQVVPSGPGANPEVIHQLLLTAIYAARNELVMTTPYFVPDDAMITALLSAALRGVDVTIILPAKNDSLLVRYASVAHFDDLMSAGVRIAQFHGGLLHTKSITVDGELSIFGSVNLDMRSLWLNFEISLFVYDKEFTQRLKSLQQTYRDQSDLVDLETWRSRPAHHRIAENTLRLFGPLL